MDTLPSSYRVSFTCPLPKPGLNFPTLTWKLHIQTSGDHSCPGAGITQEGLRAGSSKAQVSSARTTHREVTHPSPGETRTSPGSCNTSPVFLCQPLLPPDYGSPSRLLEWPCSQVCPKGLLRRTDTQMLPKLYWQPHGGRNSRARS